MSFRLSQYIHEDTVKEYHRYNYQMDRNHEILVIVSALIPSIFGLLPLMTDSYGYSGFWCYIQYQDKYSSVADILWFVIFFSMVCCIIAFNLFNYV